MIARIKEPAWAQGPSRRRTFLAITGLLPATVAVVVAFGSCGTATHVPELTVDNPTP